MQCFHTYYTLELEGVLARLSVLEAQGVSGGDKDKTISKEEDAFDLFGSEDEEEADIVKQERLQRYAEKKAKSKNSLFSKLVIATLFCRAVCSGKV